MLFISLGFLVLATICNAIMDKSKFHYHKSVFRDWHVDRVFRIGAKFYKITLDRHWWDGTVSWKNKYVDRDFNKGFIKWNIFGFEINKPVQLTDAFHFFKMWMIIFIVLSIVTFPGVSSGLVFISYFLLYGITWNLTFSTFFHKIFEKELDI